MSVSPRSTGAPAPSRAGGATASDDVATSMLELRAVTTPASEPDEASASGQLMASDVGSTTTTTSATTGTSSVVLSVASATSAVSTGDAPASPEGQLASSTTSVNEAHDRELASELRRRLFQRFRESVAGFEGERDEDDDEAEDRWYRSMGWTQRDIKNFFSRWKEDELPVLGDEVESLLRLCVFPELNLTHPTGPDVLSKLILAPKPRHSRKLMTALAALSSELPSGDDDDLRDSLLVRQIKELFGTRDFLQRLQTTLAVNKRLLALVSVLMSIASLDSASTGEQHGQLGDLPLLTLGRLQASHVQVEELRARLRDALDDAQREREHQRENAESLALARTEGLASHGAVVQLTGERDELRDANDRLTGDLDAAQALNRKLSAANRRLREQLESNEGKMMDKLIKQLYEFTWEHGRVTGDPAIWYRFLRAAALGSTSELPAGISNTLNCNAFDTRVWGPPKPIESLASYKPIDTARPSPTPSTGASYDPAPRDSAPSSDSGQRSPAQASSPKRSEREAKCQSRSLNLAQLYQEEDEDETGESDGEANVGNTGGDHESGSQTSEPGKDGDRGDFVPHQTLGSAHQGSVWFVELAIDPETRKDCVKVPRRLHGEPASASGWPQVPHPFALGAERGHRSTVPFFTMNERQLCSVFGIPTQSQKETTSFSVNYQPSMSSMVDVMDRLASYGVEEYEKLMETKPWIKMWRERVRHLFLIDPDKLSQAQRAWMTDLFRFQFTFAEAFWLLGHYLAISKEPKARANIHPRLAPWYRVYAERARYLEHFRSKWKALNRRRPAGLTQLIWSEPAVWLVGTTCSWIPRDPEDGESFAEQVEEIDELEPLRVRWASAPGRFVEALLPEHLQLLESRVDAAKKPYCWALPAPHDSTDPAQYSATAPTGSLKGFIGRHSSGKRSDPAGKPEAIDSKRRKKS